MKSDLPIISIVIPNLNNGEFLVECLQSLVDQSYPFLEIIVMDGGSKDGSLQVISDFEHVISYWCSEKDKGQVHALNKGLKYVSGELFNWLNSDDILLPNALHHVAEVYLAQRPSVIAGRCVHFEHLRVGWLKTSGVRRMRDLEKALVYHDMGQPAHFYQTNIVRELGEFDDRFHFSFDFDLWMRFLLKYGQDNLYVLEEPLAGFRIHPNSKTSTSVLQFLNEDLNIWHGLFQKLGDDQFISEAFSIKGLKSSCYLPDTSVINKRRLWRYFCYHWFKVCLKKGQLEISRKILKLHVQRFWSTRSRILITLIAVLLMFLSADTVNRWMKRWFSP